MEVVPRRYRPAGVPDTWEMQAHALLAWAGRGSALCFESAAAVLGLKGYERTYPIHVSVSGNPKAPRHLSFQLAVHPRRLLGRWDVILRDQLRITRVERTLFDLGARLTESELEHAIDEALIARLTEPNRLWACLKRVAKRGRKGAGHFGAVLRRRGDTLVLLDSHLESEFMQLFASQSLPPPRTRFPDPAIGRPEFYLDFAYPQWRIAIEADSKQHHTGERKRDKDDDRTNILVSRGWSVFRFRKRHMRDPAGIAHLIWDAIESRAPEATIDRPRADPDTTSE